MQRRIILVPHDGSAFSRQIIPHILPLFTQATHDVILLRVAELPIGITSAPWPASSSWALPTYFTARYIARARQYVPALRAADVVAAPAGVRAQAVDPDGSLVDDFRISHLGPVTAVRNAPSPAATSCLAIADHLLDHLTEQPAG